MCKTKGGLTRHTNAKHTENKGSSTLTAASPASFIDEDILKGLLVEMKNDMSKDLCYLKPLRNVIENYTLDHISPNLLNEVKKHYDKLNAKGDAEQFLKNFYSKIVLHSDTYFKDVGKPYSTLMAKRLSDKLLFLYRKPAAGPSPKPLEISDREFGALQYLSGYVVGKLLKKTKNHKNYKSKECQAIILVLTNMITSNCEDQTLIQALTRGGLKAVKPDVQSIFKIVEERYRVETCNKTLFKIDTKQMVTTLLRNADIRSLYNGIAGNMFISLDKELKENLLEKMISLYLRVRAFSTAKDTIQKYRNEQKKTKSKGLRKSLKKAAEAENVPRKENKEQS